MKGSLVADEMFPEGAGPYMDIDEVISISIRTMLHTRPALCILYNRYAHGRPGLTSL